MVPPHIPSHGPPIPYMEQVLYGPPLPYMEQVSYGPPTCTI